MWQLLRPHQFPHLSGWILGRFWSHSHHIDFILGIIIIFKPSAVMTKISRRLDSNVRKSGSIKYMGEMETECLFIFHNLRTPQSNKFIFATSILIKMTFFAFKFLRHLLRLSQLQLMFYHSNDGGISYMTELWFIQEH